MLIDPQKAAVAAAEAMIEQWTERQRRAILTSYLADEFLLNPRALGDRIRLLEAYS